MQFLKYSRPYDAKTLDPANLTPAQQDVRARLQAIIDELAETRPTELSGAKP